MSAHTDRQKLQRDCKGSCEKQEKKYQQTSNTIKLVCMKSQSVTTADKWGGKKISKTIQGRSFSSRWKESIVAKELLFPSLIGNENPTAEGGPEGQHPTKISNENTIASNKRFIPPQHCFCSPFSCCIGEQKNKFPAPR